VDVENDVDAGKFLFGRTSERGDLVCSWTRPCRSLTTNDKLGTRERIPHSGIRTLVTAGQTVFASNELHGIRSGGL